MSRRELQALKADGQELLDNIRLQTLYGKERGRLESRTEEMVDTRISDVDTLKGRVAKLEAD